MLMNDFELTVFDLYNTYNSACLVSFDVFVLENDRVVRQMTDSSILMNFHFLFKLIHSKCYIYLTPKEVTQVVPH